MGGSILAPLSPSTSGLLGVMDEFILRLIKQQLLMKLQEIINIINSTDSHI